MNESRESATEIMEALDNEMPLLVKAMRLLVARRTPKADIIAMLDQCAIVADLLIAERETTKPDPHQRKPIVAPGYVIRWCVRCGPSVLLKDYVKLSALCPTCLKPTIPWARRFDENP